MRTTVDIPDELYRHLKVRAAASGMKVKELITRYLEGGLAAPDKQARGGQRRPIPVLLPKRGGGAPVDTLTAADLRRMEEAEDLERYVRSLGR